MKTLLYGVFDSSALVYVGDQKVVVNTVTLSAEPVDEQDELIEFAVAWYAPSPGDPTRVWEEIAGNSLSQTVKDGEDVTVLSASANVSRAYTVPARVAANARGVSPGARLTPTASLMRAALSSGHQVSLQNLAYMERFFDAHATHRADPDVWSAWGGNAGRSWVRGTFAKIDRLTASVPESVNLHAFSDSDDSSHTFWVERSQEFTAQVVALYQLTPAGTWLAWGDGDWVNCESPDEDRLVQVDDETAIYVAGALFDAPERAVDLRTLNPEEWDLAAEGYHGTDWRMVDLVAAGPAPAPNMTPGQYTPQERSKNASVQLRDANGRFAKAGDTGVMSSGVGATIERVDSSTNNLLVRDANGNRYLVPANSFKVGGTATTEPPKPSGAPDPVTGTPGSQLPPLDLDEILAEPRVTDTTPKAWLKKLLQPMGAAQLKKVVDNYSDFIHQERQKRGDDFAPHGGFLDPSDPHPKRTEKIEDHLRKSIHQHDRAAERLADKLHRHHGENAADEVTAAGNPNSADPTQSEAEMEQRPDPDTSDVPAMHLAIVDKDDPRAVTDLVALVPADNSSDKPTLFRRVAGSWVEDVKLLGEIRSPTPPAVVKLTDTDYKDVLNQVDSAQPDDGTTSADPSQPVAPLPVPAAPVPAAPAPGAVAASGEEEDDDDEVEFVAVWDVSGLPVHLVAAFTAAGEGGLDRNRGGAEKLRRYWLYGPGALKIRWNTPGDWTRCVRHLEKYLGPRAKGYCQLRHHEATGEWTGDKAHRAGFTYSPGGEQHYTTDFIKCQDDIVLTAAATARRELAIAQVNGTMNTPDGPQLLGRDDAAQAGGGKEFSIPLVIPEGIESGDGRTFDKGSLTMRDLPLPLMWQFQTGDGHDGSVLVGRIDHVERTSDGLGNATGVFDTGPYGKEAQRLVENEMLRWVSADLDQFEAEQIQPQEDDDETGAKPKMGTAKMNISKGRLMGITLVPKPAFQEALIALAQTEEEIPVDDGTYVGEPAVAEAEQIVASAGIAEAIPVEPPSVWFDRPILNGVTPITVTDDGQVFGHVATWDMDHIGLPRATRAPRNANNYAYFHTGVLRCEDGSDVHVGQLTLAGGHADMLADASSAVRHYDDTGSAIADVHVGEDSYGIWCSGALRPGATPEQIRALRASAPSGDWRRINNRLELVAICQVNVPGFPVPRAQVASGAVCALVAAGTAVLSKLRVAPIDELDLRLRDLEAREQARAVIRASAIRERMEPIYQEQAVRRAELTALAASARTRVYKVLDVDGYLTEFKDFSDDKRKKLAGEKKAMPDGSFPIENASDLRRAVYAYGRASEDKKARVRRHITRCARMLDKTDLIPDDWSENALNSLALAKMDAQETITASLTARADAIRDRVTPKELGDGEAAG